MSIDTKVLLIDDHQLTRSLLRGLLREADYVNIRDAVDAASGLKLAQHFSPELVCLDMQMPGRTGLEMLAELKAVAPRAVVLMVTASSDRDTVMACMNAGAHGYIVKPFNALTVLKVIDAAMAKQRARPPLSPLG
jgi:two-component system chemotaxis response regulator CheY